MDCGAGRELAPSGLDGAQQLGEVGSAVIGGLYLFFVLHDIHAGRAGKSNLHRSEGPALAHLPGIMRICRIGGRQDLLCKLLGIVFRTISQEGRLVIVDRDPVIIGHAIDHGKARDRCGDGLLNQMDQIVIGQPGAKRARIVDLCGDRMRRCTLSMPFLSQ